MSEQDHLKQLPDSKSGGIVPPGYKFFGISSLDGLRGFSEGSCLCLDLCAAAPYPRPGLPSQHLHTSFTSPHTSTMAGVSQKFTFLLFFIHSLPDKAESLLYDARFRFARVIVDQKMVKKRAPQKPEKPFIIHWIIASVDEIIR